MPSTGISARNTREIPRLIRKDTTMANRIMNGPRMASLMSI